MVPMKAISRNITLLCLLLDQLPLLLHGVVISRGGEALGQQRGPAPVAVHQELRHSSGKLCQSVSDVIKTYKNVLYHVSIIYLIENKNQTCGK